MPQTCFNSPQLTFTYPDGTQFCALPLRTSAPLRPVTVRDTIGDLPPVKNGAVEDELDYDREAISAYQKDIRRGAGKLRHHVCKLLNELNLRRCELIPKESCHDWRYLRELVQAGTVPEKFQPAGATTEKPIVPDCLCGRTEALHNGARQPKIKARRRPANPLGSGCAATRREYSHSALCAILPLIAGWRGLYSRLDLDGHFPTSVTDPNPMGKARTQNSALERKHHHASAPVPAIVSSSVRILKRAFADRERVDAVISNVCRLGRCSTRSRTASCPSGSARGRRDSRTRSGSTARSAPCTARRVGGGKGRVQRPAEVYSDLLRCAGVWRRRGV